MVVAEVEECDFRRVACTKRVYSPTYFLAPKCEAPSVCCVFAMDELIKSLPPNTTTEYYDFSVLAYDNTIDENVCTKEQAAAAKAKGWMPKFFDGTDWLEYEGSDDVSAINGIKMDAIKKDTPVYNLRGQRLTAPQKGINIIGGRKVVVK